MPLPPLLLMPLPPLMPMPLPPPLLATDIPPPPTDMDILACTLDTLDTTTLASVRLMPSLRLMLMPTPLPRSTLVSPTLTLSPLATLTIQDTSLTPHTPAQL